VPGPRIAADVILDAYADVLRCRGNECGALLPVGWDCACPVCGDDEGEAVTPVVTRAG